MHLYQNKLCQNDRKLCLSYHVYTVLSFIIYRAHDIVVLDWSTDVADESTNVNCSFRDEDICGYTTGRCWRSSDLSYGAHGHTATTLFLLCMIYRVVV